MPFLLSLASGYIVFGGSELSPSFIHFLNETNFTFLPPFAFLTFSSEWALHCTSALVSILLKRALPIRILSVGKKRSRGLQLMVDEYVDKLRYYCSVEDVQIRPNPQNARDQRAQVDAEDEAVMNLIRSDDWVVMLDERGQDIGSEQMAELVGDAGNTGASRLSFCIGGPYGHGRKMRERANLSIKLSSLVLNHQIALLVLVEQLYR
ncbi:hypothetical protein JHK84_040093 [Glycine max]|nr:hypothetical protein JHK85_040462 [Glycine max]KAG5121753.1 hypothetical protein JHK84_040093 [Glycine max]